MMKTDIVVRTCFLVDALEGFFEDQEEKFNHLIEWLFSTIARHQTIYIFGNGGSACQAQHFATEMVGKFRKDVSRMPLSVICLNSDVGVLTAVSNDSDFDNIFARQIQAHGKPGDVAIGLTTSGKSRNVILGLLEARHSRMTTVALTGEEGISGIVQGNDDFCDVVLKVPTTDVPLIQEVHLVALHVLARELEELVVVGLRKFEREGELRFGKNG